MVVVVVEADLPDRDALLRCREPLEQLQILVLVELLRFVRVDSDDRVNTVVLLGDVDGKAQVPAPGSWHEDARDAGISRASPPLLDLGRVRRPWRALLFAALEHQREVPVRVRVLDRHPKSAISAGASRAGPDAGCRSPRSRSTPRRRPRPSK